MFDKSELYHDAQGWFARNTEIYHLSRHHSLEIFCEKISEVMNASRVGVWFFTIDKEAVYEEITYDAIHGTSHGKILKKSEFPKYFSHINQERVVICDDILQDNEMSELRETYFLAQNIRASLDAPIYSDGVVIGILCCENRDEPRKWDLLDKMFASTCSDSIGRLIESEKRHTYEKDLRHRINYLENDLKKKLDDLNEAKLSLDLALESAQVGKWDWRIGINQLVLNKTWFTKLGYHYNELPQDLDTFRNVLHPEDSKRVFDELEKHLRGDSIFYECRYRMITKSGDVQWCLDRGCIIERDEKGKATRLIGVNVNVTPIVKWEQSVIVSEQQLKAMIRSLPVPVAMFDKNFNYLAFSSRWLEEWQDYSKAELGRSILDDFLPEWIETMKRAISGEIFSKEEDMVKFGNETNLWLRWAIQPWRKPNQEVGGVIVVAENISSKKEAEIRLTQASKLSALGEMAGGIAHEINNPLSIIKGYIDLLRRHSSRQSLSSGLLQQYIGKMDQTVERISRIVNGMRRFSRESSWDEKVNYSLNKIIEETLDICQEKIKNNGTNVQVDYLASDVHVYCRPVEISQVILNLINNSYQATSESDHPWIKIKMKELPEFVKVIVIDSGNKIPLSVRQKLFQPFFTTKEIGLGTGLGLSISRGIVEEHKGRLYYDDNAQNTTFVIELPKSDTVSTEISQ